MKCPAKSISGLAALFLCHCTQFESAETVRTPRGSEGRGLCEGFSEAHLRMPLTTGGHLVHLKLKDYCTQKREAERRQNKITCLVLLLI